MMANRSRSTVSLRRSKKCLILAFATAVCWILMLSNLSVSGASEVQAPRSTAGTASAKGVIDLTSKSFGSEVGFGDGEVWLIEFYTPGCSHCVNFASTYDKMARTLHSSTQKEDKKIKVARVNCSMEKALMTRFGIKAFPSFFLVSGLDVYEFEGRRSEGALMDFVKGGYKKQSPIPFMNSPMGPMGLMQGSLIFVGTRAMGILEDMHTKFGISPIFAGVILSMVAVFCGMVSIVLLTILSTPTNHEKMD